MKFFSSFLMSVVAFVGFNITASAQVQGPGEWTLLNGDAPWEARAGLQAVYLNERFYLMGGRTPNPPSDPIVPGDSRIWNDVWISDDLGVNWSKLLADDSTGSRWSGRAYFQAVTLGDHMYVLGGQNFKSVPNPDCLPPFLNCSPFISTSEFFNDVWRSSDGENWEMMTDSAGWSGRAGFSSVVFNDEIYVMGGSINDDASIVGGPPARIYLNDVWKSSDGANWVQLSENAPWQKRAGGIAAVKDGYIWLFGGEEGFVCLPGSPCPPYFNDVWRTQDGITWEEITPQAEWKKRPGHQVVVLDDLFVLFGGFGLSENIFDPFAAANPRDIWVSENGAAWERISRRPWNALTQEEIKYDFDAFSIVNPITGQMTAYTFGGDRESFDFTDPLNYLNVDNDVWSYCLDACSVISSIDGEFVDGGNTVTVYPLPATDLANIDFTSLNGGSVALEFYDNTGKKMLETRTQVSPGAHRLQVDISNIPAGIYFVRMMHDGRRSALRVMKNTY